MIIFGGQREHHARQGVGECATNEETNIHEEHLKREGRAETVHIFTYEDSMNAMINKNINKLKIIRIPG